MNELKDKIKELEQQLASARELVEELDYYINDQMDIVPMFINNKISKFLKEN